MEKPPKLRTFRFQIPAYINLSIEAVDEQDAISKAEGLRVDQLSDGTSLITQLGWRFLKEYNAFYVSAWANNEEIDKSHIVESE